LKTGGGATRHTPVDWRDSERITDGQVCQWCRAAGEESPTKTKGGLGWPPYLRRLVSGLYRLHILGLPPLGALYHIELYLLAFLQTAESARLNRGEVNKHVLAALTADKTIALGIVKPLYCSCFHDVARFLFVRYALCPSQNFFRQVTLLSRELLKTAKIKRSRIVPHISPKLPRHSTIYRINVYVSIIYHRHPRSSLPRRLANTRTGAFRVRRLASPPDVTCLTAFVLAKAHAPR